MAIDFRLLKKSNPPINRHPVTNEVVWFCNIHNHSRYLRDNRMCTVPEVGMTEVYNGNLKRINEDDLDEIDRASRKNIVPVAMKRVKFCWLIITEFYMVEIRLRVIDIMP